MSANKIDHWMMFGTFGQQRYFVYPNTGTYCGVIINANMAAYAPDGLAAFLTEKTKNLNYIIDPLTHAFQHEPSVLQNDDGEVKKAFDIMARRYGPVFARCVDERIPVLPKHFRQDSDLRLAVDNCLQFQKNQLSEAMKSSDAMKYLDPEIEKVEPYALIAPYFYMTESSIDRWLPICARSASFATELKEKSRVFSAVVVSQGIVSDEDTRNRIITEFDGIPVKGFLLWVDDLDEETAGKDELAGLLELARGLRGGSSREVVNLHGGYFSVLAAGLLGNNAMSGVTHAPEFGEHRSVIPVGGGIPIARYYMPRLHIRVRYRDALGLLNAKGWLRDAETFHDKVCNCDECRDTISGEIKNFRKFGIGNVKSIRRGDRLVRIEYPTEETKKRCLRHYLQRKAIEYQFSATANREQILEDLDNGISEFEEVGGLELVAHLTNWKEVLSRS
jgi:hypothetical protein